MTDANRAGSDSAGAGRVGARRSIAPRAARVFALVLASTFALHLTQAQAQAQGRQVDVAQIVPKSGPLANVGNEVSAVTQATLDDFNRRQTEWRITLRSFDDGNVAERSAELAQGAPKEVVAFLSCFGTVGCLAQQKVAAARRLPLVGAIAGAAPLRGPESGMSYAVRASAADELKALLVFAQTGGMSRVAVLVQDDGFGRAYAGELDKLATAYGDLQLSRVTFKPDAPDYKGAVAAMRKNEPKAVLLLANAAHSTAFLQAWRETAALPFVFNLAGQANALFASRLKGYTGAAAFVTVTPSPWAQRTAVQRDYHRVATEAKLPLSYLGFEAFLNARFLIDSLQRSNARNGQDLARYLDALASRDIGGLVVDYASRRHGGSYTDLAVLRSDGTYMH